MLHNKSSSDSVQLRTYNFERTTARCGWHALESERNDRFRPLHAVARDIVDWSPTTGFYLRLGLSLYRISMTERDTTATAVLRLYPQDWAPRPARLATALRPCASEATCPPARSSKGTCPSWPSRWRTRRCGRRALPRASSAQPCKRYTSSRHPSTQRKRTRRQEPRMRLKRMVAKLGT